MPQPKKLSSAPEDVPTAEELAAIQDAQLFSNRFVLESADALARSVGKDDEASSVISTSMETDSVDKSFDHNLLVGSLILSKLESAKEPETNPPLSEDRRNLLAILYDHVALDIVESLPSAKQIHLIRSLTSYYQSLDIQNMSTAKKIERGGQLEKYFAGVTIKDVAAEAGLPKDRIRISLMGMAGTIKKRGLEQYGGINLAVYLAEACLLEAPVDHYTRSFIEREADLLMLASQGLAKLRQVPEEPSSEQIEGKTVFKLSPTTMRKLLALSRGHFEGTYTYEFSNRFKDKQSVDDVKNLLEELGSEQLTDEEVDTVLSHTAWEKSKIEAANQRSLSTFTHQVPATLGEINLTKFNTARRVLGFSKPEELWMLVKDVSAADLAVAIEIEQTVLTVD